MHPTLIHPLLLNQPSGNDGYVQVLLHCDGADAATTFTDSSRASRAVTVTGQAQFDQAEFRFGGASALFDGAGDYLSVADAAALRPGTGDFTVDYWIRYDVATDFQTTFAKGYTGVGDILAQTSAGALQIYISGSVVLSEADAPSVDVWHHYALVRSGSSLNLWRDGVLVGSTSNSTDLNSTQTFYIGGAAGGGGGHSVFGWIDEFRYSVGTARWRQAFAPPTRPYS